MRSSGHFMDIDEIWRRLRPLGRYQIRILLVTWFAALPQAWHVVSIVFIGQEIPYYCSPDEYNDTSTVKFNQSLQQCSITSYVKNNETNNYTVVLSTSCRNGYTYEQPRKASFVSEWDLVCDRDVLAKLSQTLVLAGMFLGATATSLADRYGRKPVHIVCNIGLFGVTLAMAFVKNFYGFLVLRFFTGTFQQGMLLTVCIIWLELVPGELRSRIGLLVALAWTVSVTTVTPFAYFLSPFGWRGIQLGLALYSAIVLLEIIFLDESLRWLIAHNRVSAATNLVKRVARLNKVSFSQVQPYCDVKGLVVKSEKEIELLDKDKDSLVESKAVTTKTILKAWKEIFKDSHLRINAFVIWAVWIVNNLTYYGLVSVTPSLSGDLYINFFFGCLAEMIGVIMLMALLKCSGRRTTLQTFLSLTAVAMVITGICATIKNKITNILTIVFTSVARGTIAGAFNAVYVFTPELFPTNLSAYCLAIVGTVQACWRLLPFYSIIEGHDTICRNAGLGMASGLGRLAGMLAPFCDYMVDVGLWMPGVVFGILCLLGTLSLIVISETKERQLAQSVTEMKKWSEKDKTASIDSLDNF